MTGNVYAGKNTVLGLWFIVRLTNWRNKRQNVLNHCFRKDLGSKAKHAWNGFNASESLETYMYHGYVDLDREIWEQTTRSMQTIVEQKRGFIYIYLTWQIFRKSIINWAPKFSWHINILFLCLNRGRLPYWYDSGRNTIRDRWIGNISSLWGGNDFSYTREMPNLSYPSTQL